MGSDPEISVCVVTRNRRAEVAMAVESALAQRNVVFDVRVYDNASDDGTVAMLQQQFPEVEVRVLSDNMGACHARNKSLAESKAPYIFFLDDDSYFTAPDTLFVALAYMRAHPATAAIGLPFVEPRKRGARVWSPPLEYELKGACSVRSVVTCACLARRRALLEVGGFREPFRQWGEERDLCIRLRARGYATEFVRAPRLVHLGSAARDAETMQYLGIRNTLLFDTLNIPWPWMPLQLAADTARLALHRMGTRGGLRRFIWVLKGFREALQRWRDRAPVSRAVYSQYRRLPGHGPIAALDAMPPPLRRSASPPSAPEKGPS